MTPKKWIITVFSLSTMIFFLMGYIVYWYDPYCYYRIPQNRLIVNNYRFLNAGIIKNAAYDTVVIGSSMVQNFDMNLFREKLNMNPVKLTVGALSIEGVETIYSAVEKRGMAKNIILCIDIPALNREKDELKVYPLYLYDDNKLNDFRYLYGYETWMRLLPLNCLFNFLDYSGYQLPQFYGTHDIDNIGAWDQDATYGEEIVLNDYWKGVNQVSAQGLDDIERRIRNNVDKLIDVLFELDRPGFSDKEYIFFFPPYSVLFWSDATKMGYFDHFQSAKKYAVERLSEHCHVKVFDFQALPEIMNLNNYKDATHYSAKINDLMIECFASYYMIVDSKGIESNIDRLKSMVALFDLYLQSRPTSQ